MTEKLSPMMQQYMLIKEQYQDCILFFRLGDFYEMFFDDALTASKELELTLTGKNCGLKERAPMCGVPYHAAETYIARLVERGYKVAIGEQMADPSEVKGIVPREVIRIITPGTLTENSMLSEKDNNYLLSINKDENDMSLAYCDISTGEFKVTEFNLSDAWSRLSSEIAKLSPKEIILKEGFLETLSKEEKDLFSDGRIYITEKPKEYFDIKAGRDLMSGRFGKSAEITSGIGEKPVCIGAVGALLEYISETQKKDSAQLTILEYYDIGSKMSLDKATLRNLEIIETLYDKDRKGSLLGVLDKTQTAMGARTLKRWLTEPLNSSAEIQKRLDGVENIYNDPILANNLKEPLKSIYDFERLISRVAYGSANGKDMLAIKRSLGVLPDIKAALMDCKEEIFKELNEEIADFSDIYNMLEMSISEDAPFTIREGGLIKDGYSSELDELKASVKDAKDWISGLENKERERTGIKTLKVGYNKVFGYYIDITRSNAHLVPEDYIRKQTLVNNERYITPELKEMESLVLNAETKINKLEYEVFCSIRNKIEERTKDIQRAGIAVAKLDVLLSFALCALRYGYVKPEVNDGLELLIEKGRHPVVEHTEGKGLFVANDTYLNGAEKSLAIITGPNMSGKSTYMRQTALIVLMAQAGSFVPAEKARIGIADRIFTRIGASDNLSQGQSTFFVEMSELSYILNTADERSLIILDEIGRGTSTYDGLSIARATVSYLCNEKRKVRTLFATHYHELTTLADEVSGVFNLNVGVSEENGDVIFLHTILPGAASRSYGIHVAKLAGIPKVLLEEAQMHLDILENNEKKNPLNSLSATPKYHEEENQLSLFSPGPGDELIKSLKSLDLMDIKPSEAISILEKLKADIE